MSISARHAERKHQATSKYGEWRKEFYKDSTKRYWWKRG
jgi:hypothetical protein